VCDCSLISFILASFENNSVDPLNFIFHLIHFMHVYVWCFGVVDALIGERGHSRVSCSLVRLGIVRTELLLLGMA
jgi:hypothetical protein